MQNDYSANHSIVPLSQDQAQTLLWEMLCPEAEFKSEFPIPLIGELPEVVSPQLYDVYLAEVQLLGHRDDFPRPYDWENLIPTLDDGEELLWIISKQKESYHFYVGLKFNQKVISSRDEIKRRKNRFRFLHDNFIRRAFPESQVVCKEPAEISKCLKQFSGKSKMYCVVGMPSFKTSAAEKIVSDRDEKARPYASINDILEPHLHSQDEFSIVFSVMKASGEAIATRFKRKFELRDKIKPYIERDISHSDGETAGDSVTINITEPVTTTSTTCHAAQQRNLIAKLTQMVCGSVAPNLKDKANERTENLQQEHSYLGEVLCNTVRGVKGLKELREAPPDYSITEQTTHGQKGSSDTHHVDKSQTDGISFKISRSDLAYLDKHLELALNHLQQVPGTGGYYAVGMVYADDPTLGESVSRHLKATLSGTQSFLRPMQIFNISEHRKGAVLNIPAASLLASLGIEQEVLNAEKACLSLPLPDSELPDLKMKKSVFYGRPREMPENGCSIGRIAYFENTQFGESVGGREFRLKPADVCSHVFVCGTTGSGKTERAAHIINEMPNDTRIVILETAKRTYRTKIGREGKRKLVYTLGNSTETPLRINPFYFDEGTNLKQHISVLSDAISDLLPMEALIGPKLREAVEECYFQCGWDIETSRLMKPQATPAYPDMVMFVHEVNKICRTLDDYGPEVRANYRGALLNRAMLFVDDVYQDIFSYDGNKSLNVLFPEDCDVIIEMEDMPPSEINMPAFVISIILQRIRAYRNRRGALRGEKFLTVIEEAHNVLSKEHEGSGDEKQSGKGGHLLRQVTRLLAEGRSMGLGVMVVDQSATQIAPSVIANSNTKMIFRQEDCSEIEVTAKSIGLKERDWEDLQHLGQGECIVKSFGVTKPVKLARLSESEIIDFGDNAVVDYASPFAPYSICKKHLEEYADKGLTSQKRCLCVYQKIVECCGGRFDLIRHVIGKYLLQMTRYDLVDELLKYKHDKLSLFAVLRKSSTPTRVQMREMLAGWLLAMLVFDNGDVFNPEIAQPLSKHSKEYLLAGARGIEDILAEDIPASEKGWRECVVKACAHLLDLSCGKDKKMSSGDKRNQKLVEKARQVLDSQPFVKRALADLLSFTQEPQREEMR